MFDLTKIPIRNPNPVVYPAPGECIYCGAKNIELTNEHIIPRSLNGILILPKASCRVCAKITCNFEGAVARSMFGNFRLKHKIQTRRKKERPTHIQAGIADNPKVTLNIPVEDHPAPLFMYKCSRAGILNGVSKAIDTSSFWQFSVLHDDKEMEQFQKQYGKNVTFSFRHVPDHFARTLAKIGYCYAVANLGLGAFEPLARDLILGKEKNLSYLVGGSLEISPPLLNAGHILQLGVEGTIQRAYVTVEIRLFASCHTPSYQVVVGQVSGIENVSSFVKKLSRLPLQDQAMS